MFQRKRDTWLFLNVQVGMCHLEMGLFSMVKNQSINYLNHFSIPIPRHKTRDEDETVSEKK